MSPPTRPSCRTLKERSHRHDNMRGFTLLELLVVVVIIGVLAAIAIPAYNSYVDKARKTVAISTLDTIRLDLESFHIDNQKYPQGIFFATGKENPTGLTVFSESLVEQINSDIIVTDADYSYNSATISYLLTAKAKDKEQTLMTLTPTEISY